MFKNRVLLNKYDYCAALKGGMNNYRLENLIEMEIQKPEDPFLKYALAQEYGAIGEEGKAESYYTILLTNFPDYVPTYYQFAKLYEQKGEMEKAVDIYNKGIETAQRMSDSHALRELKEAKDQLED